MGVRVTHIRNAFDPQKDRQVMNFDELPLAWHVTSERASARVEERATVTDLAQCMMPLTQYGYEIVASVNGKLVPEGENPVCVNGDSIVFCVVPEGDNAGKNILRVVAMIVVIIVSIVAPYLAPAGWGLVGAGGGLTAAGMVASAVVAIAGSVLVNALLPPISPDMDMIGSGMDSAPTYGWGVAENRMIEGGTLPVLYGTHRIVPPFIGKYVEKIGNQQELNLLFAIVDHEVASISDVRLNENPTTSYQGVVTTTRLGTLTQPVIKAFNDTRTDTPVGVELNTEWHGPIECSGNTVEAFKVGLLCPRGLGEMEDDGRLEPITVKVAIEYQRKRSGAWPETWIRFNYRNKKTVTVLEHRWSAGYMDPVYNPISGTYSNEWTELEEGSATPGDHVAGDPYYVDTDDILSIYTSHFYQDPESGIWYDGYRHYKCYWRWIEDPETYAPGDLLYDYMEIRAASSEPQRFEFVAKNLTPGEYRIRASIVDQPTGLEYMSDTWWEYIESAVTDDFRYPGTALLAVEAMATNQLSGGMPRVDCLATRQYVSVYNPTTEEYEDKAADNHAWACWDLLHNSDYGGGVPHTRIDYDSFEDWATECDTNGLKLNIYFETVQSLRAALDMISGPARASVVQLGSKFKAIMDKAGVDPVQGFLFGMGSINKGTYAESWLPMEDRADAIEISYFDEDQDYSRQQLEVQCSDYDTSDRVIKKSAITIYGVTDRAQIIKYGKYLLNCTRYLTLTASFEADVDALACIPGDIIEVAHDVPQFGYSGRIVSATENTVVLDREVTLYPETSYVIVVRHQADDTREEQALAAVFIEATTNTLVLSGTWTTIPVQYTNYSFGEVNRATKLMKVLRIGQSSDLKYNIQALEYVAEVYDDSVTPEDIPVISDLAFTAGLSANEVYKGGSSTNICLTWRGIATIWWVFVKQTQGNKYKRLGSTRSSRYTYASTAYGAELTFAVSHTTDPSDGETVTITPVGKTIASGDVGTVTAVSLEDGVRFRWPKLAEFAITGYTVRTGIHWKAETNVTAGIKMVPTDGTERRYTCTVAGETGTSEPTWPTSGTVVDGEVTWTLEDDANWDHEFTQTNVWKETLSAAEKRIQGADALTIRAWVRGTDAFDNTSVNASTASGECLNQKAFTITVGPEAFSAKYGTLELALNRTPNGGTIILKNGTYDLDDELTIPDVNLEIIGESQDGVIIRNAAGINGFKLYNLTKTLKLSTLTFTSRNGITTPTYMIHVFGSAAANSTNVLTLQHITFNLMTRTDVFDGDTGLKIVTSDSETIIEQCRLVGGNIGIDSRGKSLVCRNNRMTGQLFGAVTAYPSSSVDVLEITGNILRNVATYGIAIVSAGNEKIIITDNDIKSSATLISDANWYGISLLGNLANVSRNKIIFDNQVTDSCGYPLGISFAQSQGVACSNNIIKITALRDSTGLLGGCSFQDVRSSIISNNIVTVINMCNPALLNAPSRGISFTGFADESSGNVVNGNQIDVSTERSVDYGIYLSALANNNRGNNNQISGAGTKISDGGTGNRINKISGGTWT